ncbi:MAG TPA: threonine-phosphate decarboxylase CobD [Steroidobacteraceae bacterium]|nr:threonine-phosphate decarboxylase CobD [Steroidobacteraceae bacterium]
MHSETQIAAGRFAHHGGRLGAARSLFPDVPQPWVDLSTGINPRPYPAPRAAQRARNRLPEPTELARLEAVAAQAFGVTDPARVVATPGTECALRLLPQILNLKASVIVGPTYGSHADAWTRAGALTQTIGLDEVHTHAERAACITIVNPNNPDGRIIEPTRLLELHDSLTRHGGTLIVDEAFAEVAPEASVAAAAGTAAVPKLIVLRSFGKFFGLAGLRLGFIVAASPLAATIRGLVGEWPVSSDALAAGLAAYADVRWMDRERAVLQKSARRLDALLTLTGFELAGGTSLFRLARAPDARERFTRLLAAGILVRPFDFAPDMLRFGLPRGREQWRRLAAALGRRP